MNYNMKDEKRVCEWCGKDISHRHKSAKYCNKECKNERDKVVGRERYNKENPRYCKNCGKVITEKHMSSYCNHECKKEYWRDKHRAENNLLDKYEEKRTCLHCGKDISETRLDAFYCSTTCRDNYKYKEKRLRLLLVRKLHSNMADLTNALRIKLNQLNNVLQKRVNQLEIEQKNKERYKLCVVCGKKFYSLYPQKTTCSTKCKNRSRNRKKDKRLNSNNVVDGDITLYKVFQLDDGVCHICGDVCNYDDYIKTPEGYFIAGETYPSIDHIVPIAKGGLHSWFNVRLAHRKCNSIKSDKVIVNYKDKLRYGYKKEDVVRSLL